MNALIFAGFLKGPIGMGLIGATVAVATAVTGVTAGPSVARAVIDRVNATPEPTPGIVARAGGCGQPQTAPKRTLPLSPRVHR